MGQRSRRQVGTGQRKELPPFRLKSRVAEFERREFFVSGAVVPDYFDLAEYGNAVARQLLCGKAALIEVDQVIGTSQNVRFSVRGNLNLSAAPDSTNLKTRAVLGEAVSSVLVDELDRDQKSGISRVAIVNVANL